ncbi:unnamed protein product [marine sediment metagenome]|uniref:Uncharacterized protein n=1 Tax=marine sediment metagenome TaxID=412755 RepID=X1AGN5_9ZZZZ
MAVYLAKLKFSHLTHVWEINVAYLQTAGNVDLKSTQAAGTAIGDAWFLALKASMSEEVTFESVHVRMVDDGPFPTRVQNRIDDIGTVLQPAIPSLLTVIINLRNTAGALKRPGRVFFSGIPTTALEDGALTSAYRTALEIAVEDVLTVTDATVQLWTGDLVIARRAVGPGPPFPYTTVAIDQIEVPLELGSQILRKGRKTGLKV